MAEPDLRILSLGGGTQSAALALMSATGDLPRLDHVIFADTGGERPETYHYVDYLADVLASAKIPLHTVTTGDLYADLFSESPPVVPVNTVSPDGSDGKVGRYNCSYDYKREPITRKVKELVGDGKRGAWKQKSVEQWIGFSLDEIGRMKPDSECRCGHTVTAHVDGSCKRCPEHRAGHCFDAWRTNVFPLIDLRLVRSEVIAWFARNGHPTPLASSCWFCPHSDNERWRNLKQVHPALFDKAVELDEYLRVGAGPNRRKPMDATVYLHRSREPLATADLRSKAHRIADSGQGALFGEEVGTSECETGVCFT